MAENGARADLRPLTSLRFVAALMVFAHHAFPVAMIYELGPDGVAFFFLLSGFILTYTYHSDFNGWLKWDRVREFYIARAARIYPLQITALGLSALILTVLRGPTWGGLDLGTQLRWTIDGVLLLQAWDPGGLTEAINPPAWSISVEAFFYALFPFVASYVIRALRGAGPAFVLTVAAAVWAVYSVMCLRLPRADLWAFYALPPLRFIDFLVGMMLAITFLRHHALIRSTHVEVIAIALIALGIVCSHHVPPGLRYSAFLMPMWSFAILTFAHGRGAISLALSHPCAVRLGEASFAFYLIHFTVIEAVARLGWRHDESMVISLGVSIAFGFALFHFVENPIRHGIRKVALKKV